MLLVADNLQITNPHIARAVDQRVPKPIQELVMACERAGADAIDINSGPLTRHPEKTMTFLMETVQAVTDLPILLDTTNPEALKAGLSVMENKTTINGFSLEPARLEHILPLAKACDVDIIGYLLYPNSHVPADETERLSVAVELYNEFQKLEINQQRLIIDPVIAPLMWEDGCRQNMEILSVLKNLPDVLGFPVRTIGGVSNLSTGRGPAEKKLLMEKAFIPMLATAGLTMAMINMFHQDTVRVAAACNALMSSAVFSWQSL